ncbi:MAG: hypothetical protein AAB475_01070 [Patescibacteria group bacterium]
MDRSSGEGGEVSSKKRKEQGDGKGGSSSKKAPDGKLPQAMFHGTYL